MLAVSPDDEASHAAFAQDDGLEFTLLSDPDKKVVHDYGVWAT